MLKIIHSKKGSFSGPKGPVLEDVECQVSIEAKVDADCQVEIEPKVVYRPYTPP